MNSILNCKALIVMYYTNRVFLSVAKNSDFEVIKINVFLKLKYRKRLHYYFI